MTKAPKIPVIVNEDKETAFFICAHCRIELAGNLFPVVHTFDWPSQNREPSFRKAICDNPKSPYLKTGHILCPTFYPGKVFDPDDTDGTEAADE